MDSPRPEELGTLPCMNCGAEVPSSQAKFFAEVFVCTDCHAVAERMMQRTHKELKLVLAMMKDAIRMGLLQKKLRFRTPEELEKEDKADFLSRLGELVKAAQDRNAQTWNQSPDQKTPSGESMKLPATTAASRRS